MWRHRLYFLSLTALMCGSKADSRLWLDPFPVREMAGAGWVELRPSLSPFSSFHCSLPFHVLLVRSLSCYIFSRHSGFFLLQPKLPCLFPTVAFFIKALAFCSPAKAPLFRLETFKFSHVSSCELAYIHLPAPLLPGQEAREVMFEIWFLSESCQEKAILK